MRIIWLGAVLAVVIGSLMPANSAVVEALTNLNVDDKLFHFAAYAVLAFVPRWTESRTKAFGLCSGLAGLGLMLEILQDAVPGRSCEPLDGMAEAGGVICGAAMSAAAMAGFSRLSRRVARGLATPPTLASAAGSTDQYATSMARLLERVDERQTEARRPAEERVTSSR